ncbi:hypothetical protein K2173_016466 [Erythroxylum novogranatense]|uniref:Uncharacterized protein n=1 Tax=Erythroxylum novogranatense TaxID=1862640 RepID=A0AAV8SGG4_9ROSI|nr:hypothetical protein K2173_016466 [Erythroxylum novogranatense]
MEESHSRDAEASDAGSKRGNWVTFPFMIGTLTGLTLASGGWTSNLIVIVYLIKEFNVKSIDATQISNVVNGFFNLSPIVGAIIADTFLGSFFVILVSSCVSLLTPSKFQIAVLFVAIAMAATGSGGTRFTIATMGADQFDRPEDQGRFLDWYFFTIYTSSVISATAIVYIEESVSWGLGFVAANFIGLVIFLSGTHFYQRDKPRENHFLGLATVVIASIRKRKAILSLRNEDYHHQAETGMTQEVPVKMTNSSGMEVGIFTICIVLPRFDVGFLNRAALKTEGDGKPDGYIRSIWRLCTVHQVEDLKTLLRILPLWSSSIFLSTPIAIQGSLTVLQALTLDRQLGPDFKIPVGFFLVLALISAGLSLFIIDQIICPLFHKLILRSLTPLQRIGVVHVLNFLSMAVSALVEARRLNAAHADQHRSLEKANSAVPKSTLWLFPQIVLVGIGEAFQFPGQAELYYQEFPVSLRGTATGIISLIFGIAFYLSAAFTDLLRRRTKWLPNNINNGRIDIVYWILSAVGLLNFVYYLGCAQRHEYQNLQKLEDGSIPTSDERS